MMAVWLRLHSAIFNPKSRIVVVLQEKLSTILRRPGVGFNISANAQAIIESVLRVSI
jgi:hypothetical protein